MDLHCPYCDTKIDDPDDCYETERNYEHECPSCEKSFVFEVEYIRYYSAKKADCLNGIPHEYQMTKTYPKRYAKMCCSMCYDEKPLDPQILEQIIKDEALALS
jgi:hypothetical protein